MIHMVGTFISTGVTNLRSHINVMERSLVQERHFQTKFTFQDSACLMFFSPFTIVIVGDFFSCCFPLLVHLIKSFIPRQVGLNDEVCMQLQLFWSTHYKFAFQLLIQRCKFRWSCPLSATWCSCSLIVYKDLTVRILNCGIGKDFFLDCSLSLTVREYTFIYSLNFKPFLKFVCLTTGDQVLTTGDQVSCIAHLYRIFCIQWDYSSRPEILELAPQTRLVQNSDPPASIS